MLSSREQTASSALAAVQTLLKPLASLKLTVTLFSLAIFLIFAGTLAQARHDIWWVLHNYFRTPLAWIELKTFFPPAWFSQYPALLDLPGSIPFPGGFTIGGLMAINLLAAHGVRFKIQSRGSRLWTGLAVIALGCLVTWLVIVAGPDKDGSQASSPIEWLTLWKIFLGGLACGCVGIAWALFQIDSSRKLERAVLAGIGTVLLGLLAFLLFHVDPSGLNPSAMRILWQLLKAEAAAGILLIGCILAFRKRAGIVLLHAGVALIMANELVVHFLHKEEQMTIPEGRTVNYASDIRQIELTIVDKNASATADDVLAVPERLLRDSLNDQKPVSDPKQELPFAVCMLNFYENSALVRPPEGEKNPADAGAGTKWMVLPERPLTGSDIGEKVNIPSAYVQLTEKGSGKPLGTYMVSIGYPATQKVQVGDKEYEIALRFQREYKPYTMHLHEVRADMYLGTGIPRNYSSDLQLVDPTRDIDRRVGIRMNEPLRYGGETFYQSGFDDGVRSGSGVKSTTLQVVSNFGWMIPYIACMIVATGLLAQFSLTLVRFLKRREEGRLPIATIASQKTAPSTTGRYAIVAKILPLAVPALAVAFLAYSAMPPKPQAKKIDLYAFGKLPVVMGGRVQPTDTLARNSLRLLSLREQYLDKSGIQGELKDGTFLISSVDPESPAYFAGLKKGERITGIAQKPTKDLDADQVTELLEGAGGAGMNGASINLSVAAGNGPSREVSLAREYQPAIKWLLELITNPQQADRLRVFRIESIDVLNMLGLARREYFRYSWDEINRNKDELDTALTELEKRDSVNYSVYEKKLTELQSRLTFYEVIRGAFLQNPLPPFPTAAEVKANPEAAKQQVAQIVERRDKLVGLLQAVMSSHPPLAVPVKENQESDPDQPQAEAQSVDVWQPYTLAWLENYSDQIMGKPVNPATVAWDTIFTAYAQRDAGAFNRTVADYSASLAAQPPTQLIKANPSFEAWFNHFGPFSLCQWLYFAAFCFAVLAWLGWSKPLNGTAFWLIALTFLVHTFGLLARMYISGRPPITNLYATAIYIGWAAVLAGLILESVYRLGYGNVLASVAGFASLLVADKLSLLLETSSGGDTIGVIQAVLDTQFWLATHVTCVVTGYTATYVAGLLGVIYVIRGVFTPSLSAAEGKDLARMIYGTVCFGMFFSFVGTVLGGLWADDSWGRFWGWDPKENAALIIVLWNALVLHARWDGMVKDRGLAVLAIGGNIFASWSHFGVNQLGVGLHSYGFTEGVLLALGFFCLSQILVIGIGLLPQRFWLSNRTPPPATV